MMRSVVRVVLAVSVTLLSSGCKQDILESVFGELDVSPVITTFSDAYAGKTSTQRVILLANRGRGSVQFSTSYKQPFQDSTTPFENPFTIDAMPQVLQSGATPLVIKFAPQEAGQYRLTLRFEADDKSSFAETELVANAVNVPRCVDAGPCKSSFFNTATQKCEEANAENGVSCSANSKCQIGGVCQEGRCVGEEVKCNDNNACTLDVCNVETGCEFLPAPPCPGDGKCQVGVCDAKSGCGLAPASDGTQCGPMQTCNAAQICMSGQCVVRDPPDGYVCAEASPCQGEGRCVADQCVRDSAQTVVANFELDSASVPTAQGVIATHQHDLVLEATGAMSISGFFFSPPEIRVNTGQYTYAKNGGARRCMLWNGKYICADHPSEINGKITAVDLVTGEPSWTFDLHSARPDFHNETLSLFMSRMASQGSDRLAALFESYPKGRGAKCRGYYLVVLNAQGKMISSQPITDPILDKCNHPHPYGFSSDALGNLYISFSPTVNDGAPLLPDVDTMLTSYTRDGVFRWKFTDKNLRGGEISVATGLLYPENSRTALLTTKGTPAFTLPEDFGRSVVTGSRMIVAPIEGNDSLNGYEAGTSDKRWTYQLKNGEYFWSDQIRLAKWKTHDKDRTVALAFTSTGYGTYLKAIDAEYGIESFSCPVSVSTRSEPQLFEVSEGTLAFMEGGETCGKCDPPYADSSAKFHTLKLPNLGLANEPWVGTFGGPGHDHQEDFVSK